ncbi:MAG: hypothetical protein EOP83_05175 [Verrucomicrobiaceae bacterium]|nr:MAG: hypothetical protein EOP83_05175 [Verrucomicrobiaceae bacterium]
MTRFFLGSETSNHMDFSGIPEGLAYNVESILKDDLPLEYLRALAKETYWDNVYGSEFLMGSNGVVKLREFLDSRTALYHYEYQSAYTAAPPTLWKVAYLVVNDANLAFEARLASEVPIRPSEWTIADEYPELYQTPSAVYLDPAVHDRVVQCRGRESRLHPDLAEASHLESGEPRSKQASSAAPGEPREPDVPAER